MLEPFHQELLASLPRLRGLALALTRNHAEADDLVQQVALLALDARRTFTPGTNFGAWIGTIMRNRFRLEHRRQRQKLPIDEVEEALLSTHADHDHRIIMQEFLQATKTLTPDQRRSLALVAGEGLSYEQAAALTGCATGTVKSRVFRARQLLLSWLRDQER